MRSVNSPSPSEPLALDFEAPLPATWSITASVVFAHIATAVALWFADRAGLTEALLFDRSRRMRNWVGGQVAHKVEDGQVWRLASSCMLHADAIHLTLNALGLVALGRLLEPLVGGRRVMAWFAIGGLAGSTTSHAVGVLFSDGASGGAFALLGAAVSLGLRERGRFDSEDQRLLGPMMWGFLALNVVLSFVIPAIDAAGHMGGLIAGLVLGAGVGLHTSKTLVVAEWGVVVLFIGACIWPLLR
jgi:membrane associated rhomboid family serine protease